jgi:GNAT superfamily N-acetyltransferase
MQRTVNTRCLKATVWRPRRDSVFRRRWLKCHVVNKGFSVRLAGENDVPALERLIPLSVHGLQHTHYSNAQMDAALGSVFGVDRQLIRDQTYFVAECEAELIGCGGWSKRKTLFGSDHHQAARDDAELNPAVDAARIRAFFVHPDYARRGVGRAIVARCEEEIRAAGFKRIELASTLPGVEFYRACGYVPGQPEDVPLPNGLTLGIVLMSKNLL